MRAVNERCLLRHMYLISYQFMDGCGFTRPEYYLHGTGLRQVQGSRRFVVGVEWSSLVFPLQSSRRHRPGADHGILEEENV
jgi:hypothetical protein